MNADLEFIDIDVANRIATVTLNRPPVNAQNRVFRENLVFAFEWLDASSDVSAVILTGAGHVFSAGADLHERDSIERQPGGFYTHNRITRDTFFVVRDCTKPVIAAINGPAIGAGYALAACCDILIASTEAWIQMPELDRGLAGGAKFLQMHFSRSRSRLLFFTGRKIDAEEMYRLGVIDEVVAPEELMGTARGIAEEIVRKSPLAIAKAKAAFNAVEEMPLRDGYIYEQTVTLELSRSDDAIEARRAFLEGREPRYTGSRGGAQSVCRPDPQNSGLPLES